MLNLNNWLLLGVSNLPYNWKWLQSLKIPYVTILISVPQLQGWCNGCNCTPRLYPLIFRTSFKNQGRHNRFKSRGANILIFKNQSVIQGKFSKFMNSIWGFLKNHAPLDKEIFVNVIRFVLLDFNLLQGPWIFKFESKLQTWIAIPNFNPIQITKLTKDCF